MIINDRKDIIKNPLKLQLILIGKITIKTITYLKGINNYVHASL